MLRTLHRSLIFLLGACCALLAFAASAQGPTAVETMIDSPGALALDNSSHLYVSQDFSAPKIFRIDLAQGTISVAAGNGKECCFQEGAHAIDVSLDCPCALATDSIGYLYIGESGGYVRKVDPHASLITTVAGAGEFGSTADGSAALEMNFGSITGIAINSSGDLFIADVTKQKVFKVEAKTQLVTTVAGSGAIGYGGDGGPALKAKFNFWSPIALERNGNLLIGDYANCRIRRVDRSTGTVETVAMMGTANPDGSCRETGPGAINGGSGPSNPVADASGNIYFDGAGWDRAVYRVDARTREPSIIAGTGAEGFSGDGGPATEATLGEPDGLAIDATGNLYISDFVNNRVRRVDAKTGIIYTIAGNGLPNIIRSYE